MLNLFNSDYALELVMSGKRPKKLAVSRVKHTELVWCMRETEFTSNFKGILTGNRKSNSYSGFNSSRNNNKF